MLTILITPLLQESELRRQEARAQEKDPNSRSQPQAQDAADHGAREEADPERGRAGRHESSAGPVERK